MYYFFSLTNGDTHTLNAIGDEEKEIKEDKFK